jgi:hypothetical protein
MNKYKTFSERLSFILEATRLTGTFTPLFRGIITVNLRQRSQLTNAYKADAETRVDK